MEIIGYGEDALTLWAIKNKLHAILQELNIAISRCKYSFASFGRRGGEECTVWEFDFIILSKNASTWEKVSGMDLQEQERHFGVTG